MQPVRLILASKVGQASCSAEELKAIGRIYVKSYRNFIQKTITNKDSLSSVRTTCE